MTDLADQDSDLLLVQRVQDGDRKAFELLVTKYQRRVFRLILRFIRDPSTAEDVAQETFLRAYRAIDQFRGESRFYTWLYRIAVNTAKKTLSTNGRDPVAKDSSNFLHEDETFSQFERLTDLETPEALLASQQIVQKLNQAMDALPEDLRTALAMREIEGMSYEDIAGAMGCPVGTVRSRIFRAREAIARQLRPLLDGKGSARW